MKIEPIAVIVFFFSVVFLIAMIAAIYSDNAEVWCAQEGKSAVTGFFIYTCIERRP